MKNFKIMQRIKGLDSIRFVSALFVMLGHGYLPIPDFTLLINYEYGKIVNALFGCLFNGPAAVIVFFVISGFCIHFPFRENQQIHLVSYYVRRIIRICLPAIIAVGFYKYLNVRLTPPQYGVFWSVICELIYYLIYPIFLLNRKKFRWSILISIAYIISFGLAFMNLDILKINYDYPALGLQFTWLVGLPCWLLGCWLAENYKLFSNINLYKIWQLRFAIFFASVLLRIAKFHLHSIFVSNIITLNIFSILVCIWIGYEIVYYTSNKPNLILEKCGHWSYSLYLIHPIIPEFVSLIGFSNLPIVSLRLLWLLGSLLTAYIFFLLFEKPSHWLAVYLSRLLKLSYVNSPSEKLQ